MKLSDSIILERGNVELEAGDAPVLIRVRNLMVVWTHKARRLEAQASGVQTTAFWTGLAAGVGLGLLVASVI